MEILILSLIAGTGLTFTLVRAIPYKILMRYNLWFDGFFTLVLPFLFAGSFNGMTLAILSGIIMSLELAFLKFFTPRHRLT
jgi:hypothetical protein